MLQSEFNNNEHGGQIVGQSRSAELSYSRLLYLSSKQMIKRFTEFEHNSTYGLKKCVIFASGYETCKRGTHYCAKKVLQVSLNFNTNAIEGMIKVFLTNTNDTILCLL